MQVLLPLVPVVADRVRPSAPNASTHGMIPAMLSTVNLQNGIRATPAGSEMNVRITGSIREKNTVGAAVALEPAVRPGEVLRA